MRLSRFMTLLGLLAMLVACASQEQPADSQPMMVNGPNGTQVRPGFHIDIFAQGLRGPTAMAYGPDNKLYITQLNGAESDENAGKGQIVRLDGMNATPVVVLDGLQKPTGLVWRKDELWIVSYRSILQTKLDGDRLAPPTVVVKDLPFNGRSNGQIAVLPDRRILFEASGSLGDPNSARLLALQPGSTTPEVYATGFKNAYDISTDPSSGAVWTTDINDDPLGGSVPPDELNQISEGKDYGWPRCFADQQPASEQGGTEDTCEKTTQLPIALFEPHASPTGLEWGANTGWKRPFNHMLFVALWNGQPPRVVAVELGDLLATPPPAFVTGLKRPMDLLGARDGGLLVADFEAGVIYIVRQ